MDIHKNFARSTLASGIAAGAASFSVATGEGAEFPAGPQYVTIWNSTDYACSDLDPDKEIVRVSSRATDTFTVASGGRGFSDTDDENHNTGGKTYTVQQCLIGEEFDETLKRLGRRHWRQYQPGNAGAFTSLGMTITAAGTASTVAATSTDPLMHNFVSAGTTGSNAGVSNNGTRPVVMGRNIYFAAYVKLQETASTRVWIGLGGNSSLSTHLSSDSTDNVIAFRYSTVAGDTNWKCCTRDGTTQSAADSGVAADTVGRLFEFLCDDVTGDVKFYIDGVLVATATANRPAANTLLQVIVGEQTQENVAKNIRIAYVHLEDDL